MLFVWLVLVLLSTLCTDVATNPHSHPLVITVLFHLFFPGLKFSPVTRYTHWSSWLTLTFPSLREYCFVRYIYRLGSVYFASPEIVIHKLSYPSKVFFLNATTCPLRLRGLPPPPLRLWLKCNRLLRLGRLVGAVALSRWEWWWNERWIWGARGALNLISTNYPDHGHHGRLPLSRKNAHGRAGNRTRDLMFSSQKLTKPRGCMSI